MNSENCKSIQDRRNILENNIILLEKEYNELCKQLNKMKLTTICVYETKEEIQKQKTPKQVDVELNSPLFKRGKSKYTFQNSQIPKIEGKVKYINTDIANEIISRKELKSFDKETREPKVISNKKIENKKESIDKALVLLQRKKLNDLKILARDLKIKGYSTMKKEDLIKQIHELVKSKKEKENIVKKNDKIEDENINKIEHENIDKNENEENFEDNEEKFEDEFFDDDDKYQSDIDYE